jgi:hypothetical protein
VDGLELEESGLVLEEGDEQLWSLVSDDGLESISPSSAMVEESASEQTFGLE